MNSEADSSPVEGPRRHEAEKGHGRWVKVLVSEETFLHVHDMANQSRMRLTPYLRTVLAEARPLHATPQQRRSFSS